MHLVANIRGFASAKEHFLFEQSYTSTKINEGFSERSRIEHGVPEGSILGP